MVLLRTPVELEAMWINFEPVSKKRFAVRPFLGGVNGITGEAAIGDMTSLLRRANSLAPRQDYVILPDQKWLDGIATSPGIVKQFVATKLAPPRRNMQTSRPLSTKPESGGSCLVGGNDDTHEEEEEIAATIEWQVTGRDSVGGIQLQLIPEFDTGAMSAGSNKNVCRTAEGHTRTYADPGAHGRSFYDTLQTPEELGLTPGDTVHVKDMTAVREDRPKIVKDLLTEAPIELAADDVVELEVSFRQAEQWTFNVTRNGSSQNPISLQVSASLFGLATSWPG